MTSEVTTIFRNGVAVRERGGVEVWRRQYAPIAVDAADEPRESELAGAERAGTPRDISRSGGVSEAAASAQFTGGSAEGRAVGKHGQQVSPVHSGAQAGEVGSGAAKAEPRNLGNPPTPKGHGAGVESCPPANLQGDLFAELNPPAQVSLVNGAENARKNTPVFQSGEPMPAAPFVRGSQTSYAAAVAIEPVLGADAERVLRCIRNAGEGGRTCQEVERLLDMAHESASARVAGLLKDGRIIRTERTRQTASGRAASVLVAA
jgi:hypothetical protein